MNFSNDTPKPELRVILLAEDDEDDVFLFKEALNKTSDIEVKVVANGLEALSSFNKLPEADIIFLDVNMPHMNGIECLIKIRNNHKNVPVIILTTSANEVLMKQAKTLGASGFICKPNSFIRFQAVMEDVLSIDWRKHYPLFYLSID